MNTELENRMFETCEGLHKMYLQSNCLVYRQLLASLELDLGEFYEKTGQKHQLEHKLLDFYAKLWQFK